MDAPVAGTIVSDRESIRIGAPTAESVEADGPEVRQLLQLQMTVRSLENRLENSQRERRRLQDRLDAHRRRMDGLKSLLPFGERLSRFVSAYLAKGGGKP